MGDLFPRGFGKFAAIAVIANLAFFGIIIAAIAYAAKWVIS